MQYTLLKHLSKAESWNYGRWVFRLSLVLLFGYFLLVQGWKAHFSVEELQRFTRLLWLEHAGVVGGVLLLMLVNWSLEALKWKMLVANKINLPFHLAAEGVLAGLGLAFVTPRGLGDYAGRILMLPVKHAIRLLPAIWLGRVAQASCTYGAGLLALLYLLPSTSLATQSSGWLLLLATFVALIAGLSLSFWYRQQLVYKLNKLHRKLGVFLQILTRFSSGDILRIHILAFLRYLVFAGQFMVLLSLALPQLALPTLAATVGLIFLIKSLVPSFNFLNDLGVREFSAILVLNFINEPTEVVVWASLLLWGINILLPSVAGCLLLLWKRFKLKSVV